MSSVASILEEASDTRVELGQVPSHGRTLRAEAALRSTALSVRLAVDRVVRLFAEPRQAAAPQHIRPPQPTEPIRRFREPLLPVLGAARPAGAAHAPPPVTRPGRNDRTDRNDRGDHARDRQLP